ncbi:MAG: sigma-70 family RNA polymerase sigma factor [Mycobacterium sp.]
MALRQEEFTRLCDDVDLDRDRNLVERCQAGDPGAFGSLYARYYERLLRFCLRRLHDRHEAEDAAQEAFARAWKALPNFAGERRFYPWLTVIAGNICTDMERRRWRSTPTEDLELGARPPVGVTSAATADEMIIAADDRELAHRALDRLSVRHRHVLALREDSGWSYQQIADHEGVEIGTIETLLWRARQAFKREFQGLSESKGPLAGFLLGVGAAIRTVVVRAAHRVAALAPGGSGGPGGGAWRTAFAGVAVTTAAVAAAFVAPHALGSSHHARVALPAPVAAAATGSARSAASVTPSAGSAAGARSTTPPISYTIANAGGSISPTSGPGSGSGTVAGSIPGAGSSSEEILSGASKSTTAVTGLAAPLSRAVSGAVASSPLKNPLPATLGGIATTVEGFGPAVVSGSATTPLGSALASPAASSAIVSTTTTAAPTSASGIEGAASYLASALNALGQR